MAALDSTTTETCPYCGRAREQWTENDGEGGDGRRPDLLLAGLPGQGPGPRLKPSGKLSV